METETAYSWQLAAGAPDWLAKGLESVARQLAQAGELRSPKVWRCETPEGTTWWVTDQKLPDGTSLIDFYTPHSATLHDVLRQLHRQFPGLWRVANIVTGSLDSPTDVLPAPLAWSFSGYPLPVVRLDA